MRVTFPSVAVSLKFQIIVSEIVLIFFDALAEVFGKAEAVLIVSGDCINESVD